MKDKITMNFPLDFLFQYLKIGQSIMFYFKKFFYVKFFVTFVELSSLKLSHK